MKLPIRRIQGLYWMLCLLFFFRAEYFAVDAKWESEIQSYEALDRAKPPAPGGIIFIGSSFIRLWKSLEQDFSEYRVINRGFGGSEISDSVTYAERIVIPYHPRLVVMYAGGNDIASGKGPDEVAKSFQDFVNKVLSRLPKTRIGFISIAPNPARWSQVEKVKRANALIEQFVGSNPQLSFINVFPHMLGPDGLPRPDLFVEDRLHMNAKGYEMWTRLVKPYLKEE